MKMMAPGMFAVAFLLFVVFVGPVWADQEDFPGTWRNVDSETRGIVKLVISKEEQNLKIQGWGKCQPIDCDFGKVDFNLLGTSTIDKSFNYGFAFWDAGFASEYLTLRIDGQQLIAEWFTIFKDKSGRSNFRFLSIMRKAKKSEAARIK